MSNSEKKILIAEDSSVIQNIAAKVLSFQQYSITPAKNGKEVLKKLENEYFDVILMDINMPQMDGMECARQIRALSDEKKAAIPIVAITGNAKNYSMEDFKEAGIHEYVPKPIDFDRLVELVKQLTKD
ncbi:response regulator [Eisenibacter elegans]|uniref:response regulator n=1 Tax=Eisenibacter elegans TaxID=997 RepID=UPI0003F58354|nr:response regulator [Eisenibacter elegans]